MGCYITRLERFVMIFTGLYRFLRGLSRPHSAEWPRCVVDLVGGRNNQRNSNYQPVWSLENVWPFKVPCVCLLKPYPGWLACLTVVCCCITVCVCVCVCARVSTILIGFQDPERRTTRFLPSFIGLRGFCFKNPLLPHFTRF